MATAPSPNDLTRQQLDELDALLQRMLSSPLPADPPAAAGTGGSRDGRAAPAAARGGVESGPALADPPLPPSWRIDPPPAPRPSGAPVGNFVPNTRDAPAPHLALAEPPSSVSLKFEPPAPPAVPPTPPAALVQTPAPAAALKPTAKPAAPPAPAPKPAPAAVAATPPKATAGLTPAPSAPQVPVLFLPFLALNVMFDRACGAFGPPGLLLRSGLFKQLYGLTGLGLLLYTAAHVAQTRLWITLPVPLPWPQ